MQEASSILARHEQKDELYISASRLAQIENDGTEPGNYKLLALSAIYGLDFLELLAQYDIRPDCVHQYRQLLPQRNTHLLSTNIHDCRTKVTVPLHVDPRFRWQTTQLINEMVSVWGEIPASMLVNFNPRNHMVGLVGLEDRRMWPLIRPGALVLVNGDRRKITLGGWANEQSRPIYFIELREGYRCSWCELRDGKLIVVPHPASGVATECFNFPNDAEIVGEVVGIAMRIGPAAPIRER